MVDTLGGRKHMRWDKGAAATPHGQLVFFAEFLAATGVFERWVSSCPLRKRSTFKLLRCWRHPCEPLRAWHGSAWQPSE